MAPMHLFSQTGDDSTSEEKATARLSIQYFNLGTEEKLVGTVKSRIDGTYQLISGVKVNFYKDEISEEFLLGSDTTNKKGEATFKLGKNSIADTSEWTTIIAAIEESADFEDTDDEITLKRAVMEMNLEEEDSIRWIRILISSTDETGEMIPAAEVEVKIVVKRLFGLLPIGEGIESTDEEGNIDMEFPQNIPGDKDGNLTVIAKVEDHDEFGNLEIRKSVAWGVPVTPNDEEIIGELWSSRENPPWYLLFIVNSILAGTLGTLVYILFQLISIKKLG
jgi:hypothetical protein